uniref:Protein CREG1-like n=1 Tax=Hirondellea gigas TaxID=1518452 RepID=A0A2P2HY99_9CRUS
MTGNQYKPLTEVSSKRRICCSAFFLTTALCATVILVTVAAWQYQGRLRLDSVVVNDGALLQVYPPPPPYYQYARVARYITHVSDWASLATVSTHEGIQGYPFTNVFSISDGTVENSTGTPYFYLTALDLSVQDLQKDPRASMTASLAQSNYCRRQDLDPQDPRCAHLILTGEIVKLKRNSAEEDLAKNALFERHPEMLEWPTDHDWFFARLAIRHIYLLDFFGGAKVITPEDYYAASPTAQTDTI